MKCFHMMPVVGLAVSMCIGLASTARADGLELDPAELRGESKTHQISVLQSRYFTKVWRPEFGVAVGSFLNEAYTNTATKGVRLALFPSEWIGFEAQYFTTNVTDTADRKALNKLKYLDRDDPNTIVSPDPEVNRITKVIDYNLVATPFYGKLNFLDLAILYSDLYITTGGSRLSTDQGTKSAWEVGAGERFYFAKSFCMRIDFRDRVFQEMRAGLETRRNAYSFDVGLSYLFL